MARTVVHFITTGWLTLSALEKLRNGYMDLKKNLPESSDWDSGEKCYFFFFFLQWDSVVRKKSTKNKNKPTVAELAEKIKILVFSAK